MNCSIAVSAAVLLEDLIAQKMLAAGTDIGVWVAGLMFVVVEGLPKVAGFARLIQRSL